MPHNHTHHDHHDHHDHAEHDHGSHHHGHVHSHGDPTTQGKAFAIAIALNALFVVVELVYGYLAHSTALMADAGHNLSDVLGLGLAWGAAAISSTTPNSRFTYGLRGSSTLVALANAAFLLISCGAIGLESVQRFWTTPAIDTTTVIVVALVGILVNGFSALLFMKGNKDDMNIRGAYLHMAADAGMALGVVGSAAVIRFTGWNWLDPVTSIVIVLLIIRGTWGLLRESLRLALHAVPQSIRVDGIEAYLRGLAGVTDIHDLHIWGMSTTESALTVHLVVPAGYPGDEYVDNITAKLKESYSIQHATIQVEQGTTHHACSLHPVV